MKRVDLIRHIEASGCAFLREGGRHTVYVNPTARKVSTVPRHREINEFMAKKRSPPKENNAMPQTRDEATRCG